LYLEGDAVADAGGNHGLAVVVEGVLHTRLVLHPFLVVAEAVVELLGVGTDLAGVSAADELRHRKVVASFAGVES
jgi:hypothetical protein